MHSDLPTLMFIQKYQLHCALELQAALKCHCTLAFLGNVCENTQVLHPPAKPPDFISLGWGLGLGIILF